MFSAMHDVVPFINVLYYLVSGYQVMLSSLNKE